MWLMVKKEEFVLIDAGTGASNLHQFLLQEKIITEDKPLTVILTHKHNDHAGGARHFMNLEKVTLLCHADDRNAIESGEDEVQWGGLAKNWVRKPFPEFDAEKFVVMDPSVKVWRSFLFSFFSFFFLLDFQNDC
jgi:glyoxylase-like metal-dependent hydrolase (beta-lactamase superfamily II)